MSEFEGSTSSAEAWFRLGRSTTILGVKEGADAWSGLLDGAKGPLFDVEGGGERTRGTFEVDRLVFPRAVLITFCGLTGSVPGSGSVAEGVIDGSLQHLEHVG